MMSYYTESKTAISPQKGHKKSYKVHNKCSLAFQVFQLSVKITHK